MALVHNGIIENFRELRAELVAKGHQFDARLGPAVLVAMAAVFFLIALRDFRRA